MDGLIYRMAGMILISAKNEKATVIAQQPRTETPWVLEVTTVADDLLPALPPRLANVQQPKALVANVRCHYQTACGENASEVRNRRKEVSRISRDMWGRVDPLSLASAQNKRCAKNSEV